MTSVVVKLYNKLVIGLAICAALVIVAAFLLIVFDVLVRAAGYAPPAFTIAAVEYMMLYFALFAAPFLVRKKGHVHIDTFTHLMPSGARRAAAKVSYVIAIAASSVVVYFSTWLLMESIASGAVELRGVDVPQWINYAPLPLIFAMVGLEFGRYLIGLDDYYEARTEISDSM